MPHLLSIFVWLSGANPLPAGFEWVILGVLILIALISLLVPLMARRNVPTDENSWKGGVFYVNRADPALFVQKRFGIGYTINFGNRWAWLVMGILVVLVLAPFVFTAFTVASISHILHTR
jgi:uncharacterized membrane protein